MSDPKDDPVLVKYAGIGALAEAREQLQQLDRDARAKLDYELIDKMFATYLDTAPEKDRTRQKALAAVASAHRPPISERKVEMALEYMKQKREAEAARTPTLFTMTPEAEAKAKEFKAKEATVKADAKARFLAFLADIKAWRKRLTATKRGSLQ